MRESDECEFSSVKKISKAEKECSYQQKRCRNLEKAILENIKVNKVLDLENKALHDMMYQNDIKGRHRNKDDKMNITHSVDKRSESTSKLDQKSKSKFNINKQERKESSPSFEREVERSVENHKSSGKN